MLVDTGRVRGLTLHLTRLSADSTELFGRPVDPEDVLRRVRAAIADRVGASVVRVTV
ncbi:MAG TPA: hypothetical protein VGP36_00405 [Mycobacteriales bacterium]|jgi:hypothetical protein|nr:hypothetical protein [Mycobacteriales bacterium]